MGQVGLKGNESMMKRTVKLLLLGLILVLLAALCICLFVCAPKARKPIKFIGTAGYYAKASEPSEVPAIEVVSIKDSYVDVNIVGAFTNKIYYKDLHGTYQSSDKIRVSLGSSGAVLLFTWDDPNTITVSLSQGNIPKDLKAILKPPTYWNSDTSKTN